MKPVSLSAFDQALLRQIEHTRHRSIANFMVNLMAGIIAYCLSPNKPRIPVSVAQALQMANQTELIQN